tara:strand:- start:3236 stop:3598 length:363 start_codon:yes stop_codon:yes gene_type:complete
MEDVKLKEGPKRPWGEYKILLNETYCKVKEIIVKPQQRLSLQLHQYRSEVWVIVNGTAKIEVNDKEIWKSYGETININQEDTHRVMNPSFDNDLVFIEVQTGSYFGEDDIIRLEDDYKRK